MDLYINIFLIHYIISYIINSAEGAKNVNISKIGKSFGY